MSTLVLLFCSPSWKKAVILKSVVKTMLGFRVSVLILKSTLKCLPWNLRLVAGKHHAINVSITALSLYSDINYLYFN